MPTGRKVDPQPVASRPPAESLPASASRDSIDVQITSREETCKAARFSAEKDRVQKESQLQGAEPHRSTAPVKRGHFEKKRRFKALYLFAGAERKSDLEDCLKQLQAEYDIEVECNSIDLVRGKDHDILEDQVWPKLRKDIQESKYNAVIITPPCNTFSRARHSSVPGPRPVRSRKYPYGFPWLFGSSKRKVQEANRFVEIMVEGFREAAKVQAAYLGEHPEDLGVAASGELPASIWSLQEIIGLPDVCTGALFQCPFGAPTSKPTRLISNFQLKQPGQMRDKQQGRQHKGAAGQSKFYRGWPKLGMNGHYLGPLPRRCGHFHRTKLIGTIQGRFRTEKSAAYPPDMCMWLARNLLDDFRLRHAAVPSEGRTIDSGIDAEDQGTAEADKVSEDPKAGGDLTPAKSNQAETKETVQQKPWHIWKREENDPRSRKEEESSKTVLQDDIGDPKGKFKEDIPTSHPGGVGRPLTTRWAGSPREFHDGAGLASPGRWHPEARKECEWGAWLHLKKDLSKLLKEKMPDYEKLVYQLATKKVDKNPFGAEMIAEGRKLWLDAVGKESKISRTKLEEITPGQPFLLYAIGESLRLIGDPDFSIFHVDKDCFVSGVPVGYKEEIPRCPALYEEKVRWRKYEDMEETEAKDNYKSATTEILEKAFEEEKKAGRMRVMNYGEAQKLFKILKVAAQGAIEKADDTFRIIHDGTHDVAINPHIKIQDQLRCPSAGEGRTVMERSSEERPGVHFGLQADVSKAHRLFLHREKDRGLLACRTDKRPLTNASRIWINDVGTFGIASAAYWWSRLSSGICRLLMAMMEKSWFWQLLFADDIRFQSHGQEKFLEIILALFFWVLAGTPVAWHKCVGGLEVEWLGYWLDYSRFHIGLSESRAQWLIKWATRIVQEKIVLVANMAQGLGRLGFAAGALEWVKPFLGPAYAWTSAAPLGAVLPVPPAIWLTLGWIVDLLSTGQRTVSCKGRPRSRGELFRTDTKGEADYVVLGGFLSEGVTNLKDTPWFSLRIDKSQAPWLFEKGHGSRTIGASEMMSTMVAIHLFCKEEDSLEVQRATTFCSGISGVTDNIGNSYIVKKLMSTKIPMCAILMQMTEVLARKGLWLDLRWTPREDNIYADQLTNEDFSSFSMDKRLDICWEDVPKNTLEKLVAALKGFVEDVESRRAARKAENSRTGSAPWRKKRRAKETWG